MLFYKISKARSPCKIINFLVGNISKIAVAILQWYCSAIAPSLFSFPKHCDISGARQSIAQQACGFKRKGSFKQMEPGASPRQQPDLTVHWLSLSLEWLMSFLPPASALEKLKLAAIQKPFLNRPLKGYRILQHGQMLAEKRVEKNPELVYIAHGIVKKMVIFVGKVDGIEVVPRAHLTV